MKNNLKYNFIFFFVQNDYWKAIIGSSNEYMHVYDYTTCKTFIGKFISRLYWSFSIRNRVKLPFKKMLFRFMYRQDFSNKKPLCFVYLGGNPIWYDDGWCEYVKKQDSRNKQVVIHGDLISKKLHFDYEELRKKVDLCVTYDKEESLKYGIHHFQETTYTKPVEEYKTNKYEYDVYFLASVKDRLPMILDTYKYLHNNGAKCRFILVGVPKEKRISYEGIEYSNGISYVQNIRNVLKSKCVLEIIQGGSSDITLRAREAVAYRRRLITNCKLVNSSYFNKDQLVMFENPEDIDISKITSEMNPIDYPPLMDMDPIKRLIDIQNALDKHE